MDRVPLNDPARPAAPSAEPAGNERRAGRSWARQHRFALGSLVAVVTLGSGYWWRRRRRRRIELAPMTDQWLRQREYDAGQRSDSD